VRAGFAIATPFLYQLQFANHKQRPGWCL